MPGFSSNGLRYRPEHFETDGALRDVCVLDATMQDWQRMLDGLSALPWTVIFRWALSDSPADSMPGARELWERLERDPDENATLSLRVGEIWFTCYFFSDDEIEFTFDPADVVDEKSFSSLREFIQWLGDSTRREVIMTMEGSEHESMPKLLSYGGSPATD